MKKFINEAFLDRYGRWPGDGNNDGLIDYRGEVESLTLKVKE